MIILLDATCNYFLSVNMNMLGRPLLVFNLHGRVYSQVHGHTVAELVPVL